jgi:hypothetical protein
MTFAIERPQATMNGSRLAGQTPAGGSLAIPPATSNPIPRTWSHQLAME